MLVVGLTGGIAAGKSTILRMFKKLGAKTIDADIIAHKVLEPKTDVWKAIVEYFGRRILNNDLTIERKKIADIVFNDRFDLEMLNKITHPAITNEIKKRVDVIIGQEKDCIIIVDAPLLFESYIAPLMDKIVVVTVPARTQIQRLIRRNGLSHFQAALRVQSQIPQEEKINYADYIINGKDKSAKISENVKEIWKGLLGQSSVIKEPKISKIYFKS